MRYVAIVKCIEFNIEYFLCLSPQVPQLFWQFSWPFNALVNGWLLGSFLTCYAEQRVYLSRKGIWEVRNVQESFSFGVQWCNNSEHQQSARGWHQAGWCTVYPNQYKSWHFKSLICLNERVQHWTIWRLMNCSSRLTWSVSLIAMCRHCSCVKVLMLLNILNVVCEC